MKDKLKLLDLSKDFTISRVDHEAKNGCPARHYYQVDNKSDLYAIINDDGKIEYWGDTGDYCDFKINVDNLMKLIDYVNCLKEGD